MEKIAHEIHEILEEKLSCYRQLNQVLEDEKGHIASMNLDALWESVRIKKQMAQKIHDLRENILLIHERISSDNGSGKPMTAASFSLASLLDNLPLARKAKTGLIKLKQEIDNTKGRVVQTAKLNQVHVRKYLAVVDDIMSVVGDNSSRAQYTGYGKVPDRKRKNCLIKAEV